MRNLILEEPKVNIFGFDSLKYMCKEDSNLKEDFATCEDLIRRDRSPWMEYMLQETLFFNGSQLCIHKCSMRENLLKEKHSGSLERHFG